MFRPINHLNYAIDKVARIEPLEDGQFIKIPLERPLPVYVDKPEAPTRPETFDFIEFVAKYRVHEGERFLIWHLAT